MEAIEMKRKSKIRTFFKDMVGGLVQTEQQEESFIDIIEAEGELDPRAAAELLKKFRKFEKVEGFSPKAYNPKHNSILKIEEDQKKIIQKNNGKEKGQGREL